MIANVTVCVAQLNLSGMPDGRLGVPELWRSDSKLHELVQCWLYSEMEK
jgi:hypothetical protein